MRTAKRAKMIAESMTQICREFKRFENPPEKAEKKKRC